MNPEGHVQFAILLLIAHVPPFWQGLGSQKLITKKIQF